MKMRNDKIEAAGGVPILASLPDQVGISNDPFAFARRLQTALWVFDIDSTSVLYANASACDLWQAEDEDALRKREFTADMSPTVAKRLRQYQVDFIARDATFTEMWTFYPKGKPTSAMVSYRGLYLPDGRMAMLCEVVGNAVNEPNNLRSAEALLHTDVMISLYELNGPALYMNPAARNSGARALQGISEKFDDPEDFTRLSKGLTISGQHRMIAKVHTEDGIRWHDLSTKKCSDAVTGKPVILETAIDVSELKNARDKARYLADRDQLTGCYNRTFLAQYEVMLEKYPVEQYSLLTLDVDRFKQINDCFGHEMGDIVLREIVNRVSKTIRKNDIIIRLGGDEFVIVLEDTLSEVELIERVEGIRRNISEPITHETTRMNVTVSMGVTTFSTQSVDFTAIMREADIALYASKQAGRNCVTVFNEDMGAAEKERSTMEIELKRSIEDQDFVLYFQPRVDLWTGTVVSAEALVRWQHPDRGLIMPGDFIPICEETGMIEDLGKLILDLGCMQSVEWHNSGLDLDISINISPRQFGDKRLLQSLEKFAKDSQFPCDRVELEITESVLIGDLDEIEQKLKTISQMGYRIAIDDFGTGYSNLSYISQFPLDCLKIDQSFINQLPRSGPIISLILTLAKQIGATVVAEGVETKEQLDWLIDHGCEQAQGYFLSRPVEIGKLDEVIARLNSSS
jgi:diguanylate cyclase (GGDEF)-like protein